MLLIIRAVAVVLFAFSSVYPALAEPERHHALSLVRAPKYPADFKYFDYVNPDAPKGGTAKLHFQEPYDNLNAAVFRGALAPGLTITGATPLISDSLMLRSEEEASTAYCLLCEWVSYPSDYSSVTFKLRDNAKWHDGKPVTVDDVIFSMEVMKGKDPQTGLPYNPQTAQYYKNVVKGEKTGDQEVTFTFDTKGNRELPHIVGELMVFPKHYWTGTTPDGKKRDITKGTLEPPLGSGPYKIKSLNPGQAIAYERAPNYWGAKPPCPSGYSTISMSSSFNIMATGPCRLRLSRRGNTILTLRAAAKNWATGV